MVTFSPKPPERAVLLTLYHFSHTLSHLLMKNLTGKDWVIASLFFSLILVISPLVFWVDESPLESHIPVAISLLGGIGAGLSIPVIFISGLFHSSSTLSLNFLSWMTATVYTLILLFILSKLNARQSYKK